MPLVEKQNTCKNDSLDRTKQYQNIASSMEGKLGNFHSYTKSDQFLDQG